MDFDSLPEDPQPQPKGEPQENPTPVSASQTAPPVRGRVAAPGASFDDLPDDDETYGTPLEQVKTIAEGAAQGLLSGPIATGLETGLGISTPEAIRLRAQVNPWEHGISEFGGFVAPAVASLGGSALARLGVEGAGAIGAGAEAFKGFTQAGILGAAGEGAVNAAKAIGLGDSFAGKVAQEALRGAFETGLMQGGEELTKAVLQDPEQHAENAISNIELAGLFGGVLGGGIGAIANKLGSAREGAAKFVSEIDKPKLEAGDFATSIQHSEALTDGEKAGIFDSLKRQKPEAPEIKAAAARLGAPVMEGMVSDSALIQKGEDALLNSAPSYSGIKRQDLYNGGYQQAMAAVNSAVGEGSHYSKAELGNIFKSSITQQIEEQAAPISQLYNELKQYHEIIPLSEKSAPAISRNIGNLKELSLSPSSPEGKIASRVMEEIGNLKTVDDVKTYKSILNRSLSPTASSGEKRMVSILSDKLNDLEENSILRFAKNNMRTPQAQEKITNLIEQRAAANQQYANLMKKVGTLSEQLGKGRVYGPQDAINFIKERLTPEEVVQKLFSKKDSEFLSFFSKEFPDQMNLMREYQKGSLRDAASLTGSLNEKSLFKAVNKLEPEIQKTIFSPEELQRLKDAQTYINSFPKSFNPSGTSHMGAFRAFFESPTGAITANLRDAAVAKFIKMAGSSGEDIGQAMKLAKATVNGTKSASKAAQAIFSPAKSLVISDLVKLRSTPEDGRENLQKKLDNFKQNPSKAVGTIANSGQAGGFGFNFGQVAGNASQYLDSIKPKPSKTGFLDSEIPPTKVDVNNYNRSLDIANQPLQVIPHIKNGTLLPSDVATLKAIYPNWYNGMSQKIMDAMVDHVQNGGTVPYRVRQSLSMFLGRPLDSTFTPTSIQAVQSIYAANKAPPPNEPVTKNKKNTSKLGNLASDMKTSSQSREDRRDQA